MCYTVGPWWLPILNIAVCTEPSQTPFNFTSGGFLVLFSWLATVGICPLELREGNGGWSLPYKKRGTKKPECLGAPLGFTGKAGLFWRLRGECFPFPAWVLEAVGIPWLLVTSHQSLLPSSYCFLLWLWFLLHPFIKTLWLCQVYWIIQDHSLTSRILNLITHTKPPLPYSQVPKIRSWPYLGAII